jgi:hypothetical protein
MLSSPAAVVLSPLQCLTPTVRAKQQGWCATHALCTVPCCTACTYHSRCTSAPSRVVLMLPLHVLCVLCRVCASKGGGRRLLGAATG